MTLPAQPIVVAVKFFSLMAFDTNFAREFAKMSKEIHVAECLGRYTKTKPLPNF
tara:strand:- start:1782 stop:1943 length:162 start_codon:yes stop_codon:yes gene_type:complete